MSERSSCLNLRRAVQCRYTKFRGRLPANRLKTFSTSERYREHQIVYVKAGLLRGAGAGAGWCGDLTLIVTSSTHRS